MLFSWCANSPSCHTARTNSWSTNHSPIRVNSHSFAVELFPIPLFIRGFGFNPKWSLNHWLTISVSLFVTFCRFLAPFGTGFRARAGKNGEKLQYRRWKMLVGIPLRRSPGRNNVKDRPGGSAKSLLKLYYFLTGSGFF
jgi:hypothetical protein